MAKQQPWDIPAWPTSTYDKDSEILMAAVGSALSAWQFVEGAIAGIFEWLVADGGPKHRYINSMSPAERAYGSIISFDARAGMVEAAADAFFHVYKYPELHDRLKKIMTSCRGWSGRRNEIAHGQIAGSPISLNHCALWPMSSSARKFTVDHHPKFVYNSTQIREFEKHFFELHELVLNFYSDFRFWREKQLGVSDPPDSEPSTPETEDQSDLPGS